MDIYWVSTEVIKELKPEALKQTIKTKKRNRGGSVYFLPDYVQYDLRCDYREWR